MMKEGKKIVVLCNYLLMPERIGGMDRFFWLFDAECKKNGHEVLWFFPNSGSHGQYEDLTIISAENKALEHFFLEYSKEKALRFDIVITHFMELCTSFFKSVKDYHPSKIIAVDHNPRPVGGYPLKKKIRKKIKGMFYRQYIDRFVAVSDYSKNELLKDFGNSTASKIVIIQNGLRTDNIIIRRNIPLKLRFLTTSHLRVSKGIQDLIEAIRGLDIEILKRVEIDIYGSGPYSNELRDKVAKYNLTENVRFLGNTERLFEIYKDYSYLIHPSHEETFCFSVMESLVAEVPVIATNYPAGNVLNQVIEDENGFLFDIGNVDQLKNIIEEIILGKKCIDKINSSHIRNNFSIEKMVNEHYTLIK